MKKIRINSRSVSRKFAFLSKKVGFFSSAILVAIAGILVFAWINSNPAKASWMDENWLYRQAIPVTNNTTAETNVYISITVDTSSTSNFQAHCEDVRFTQNDGKLLKYYLFTDNCRSGNSVFHVLLDSFPAGTQTLYVYYGNPSASKGSQSADFATVASNYTVGTLASQEQSPAPVGYWKFDDNQGTTVNDASPNKNSGALGGTIIPTWQPEDRCVAGKCLFFDGSTSKVTGSKIANGIQTVSFWIRPNTIATQGLFNLDGGTHKVSTNTSGVISATGFTSPTYYINGVATATPTLTLNQWNHVSITTAAGFNSTNSFTIGADGTNFIKGFIDEVKFYPYTRTATQVKTDYLTGKANATAHSGTSVVLGSQTQDYLSNGLTGYWKMDEITGTSVADSSGNGNNGTLTNAQETGTADDTTNSNTTTLVGTNNTNLGTTNDMYKGIVLKITGGTGCGISTNNERMITGYTGSTKAIVVDTAFLAETDNCTFQIKHQTGGKYKYGLQFDGANDYVTLSNPTALQVTGALTLSAWVKLTTVNGVHDIIARNGASGSYDYRLYTDTNGKVNMEVSSDGTALVTATGATTLSANTWYHLTGTYQPGQYLQVFVNGAQDGSQTSSVPSAINNTSVNVEIGSENGGGTNLAYGLFDEVRIYNRALSPKEVSDLYNWAPGPLGYWNFEEGKGTTVYDLSGNGSYGSWTGSGNHWATGKYGWGGNFSSSDDVVTIDSSRASDIGVNDFTIDFWMKRPNITTSKESDFIWEYPFPSAPGGYFEVGIIGGYKTVSGKVRRVDYGPAAIFTSNATIADNTWHHVALVFNRAGNGVIYIDGKYDNAADISGQQGPLYHGINTLRFGGTNSAFTDNFQGQLDDIRIYDYARTQKQIISDMNANHPAVGSPVGSAIGHWKFDEGQGAAANNSGNGGSALNGTITNGTWSNAGKYGKALTFASNTSVTATITDPGYSNTLSLWINPTTSIASKTLVTASKLTTDSSSRPTFGSCVGTALSLSSWTHLVAVSDGSGSCKIYQNGVQTASGTTGVTFGTSVNIGASSYTGLIDEFKLYNYPLTADEVKLDYNRGSSQVLGAAGNNSTYQANAANQEYCVPGDTTPCAAPVGRWDFEEGRDNTCSGAINDVCDISGTGNDGAWNGTGGHWTAGKVGTAGSFNGSNDFVQVGTQSSLRMGTSDFTIEAWVNSTFTADYQFIAGIMQANVATYELHIRDGNIVRLRTDDSGSSPTSREVSATFAWNDGKWHHIVGTRVGAVGTIYIDGVYRSSGTLHATDVTVNTTNPFRIGQRSDGGWYFNGKLDQVRVFNYARTAAQVAYDYNRGAPIAWWKLDECQGATANDSSENNYSGTITVATGNPLGTCTTANSFWGGSTGTGAGKRNSAPTFDGTDDKVTVTTAISGVQSVSFWVKPATNTDSFMDLDGGTHYITASSGTVSATGFSSPAIYVNGVSGGTITGGAWNHIVVTTATSFNTTSSMTFGYKSAATADYLNGQLDDVRIYNYALTGTQVKDIYNNGAVNFGPSTGSP